MKLTQPVEACQLQQARSSSRSKRNAAGMVQLLITSSGLANIPGNSNHPRRAGHPFHCNFKLNTYPATLTNICSPQRGLDPNPASDLGIGSGCLACSY